MRSPCFVAEENADAMRRQIIGILAAFDRAILRAEEERNDFLLRLLQKQYQKAIKGLEAACVGSAAL